MWCGEGRGVLSSKRVEGSHFVRMCRDLSNNKIRVLDGESLRGLGRLRDLMLRGNLLQTLPGDCFSHTPLLLTL